MSQDGIRPVALMIAVYAAIPFMSGCGKGAPLNDATLTTRVKTAILNDPTVGKLPIDVSTANAVVTLSGRVTTEAQRDRATELARSVSGVLDVKNNLLIVPKVHDRSRVPFILARTTSGALHVVPA